MRTTEKNMSASVLVPHKKKPKQQPQQYLHIGNGKSRDFIHQKHSAPMIEPPRQKQKDEDLLSRSNSREGKHKKRRNSQWKQRQSQTHYQLQQFQSDSNYEDSQYDYSQQHYDYDPEEYYSASSEASPVQKPRRHSTRKPKTPLQVQSFVSSQHKQSNFKINIKVDKQRSHVTPQ